jgi:hypothetical protein
MKESQIRALLGVVCKTVGSRWRCGTMSLRRWIRPSGENPTAEVRGRLINEYLNEQHDHRWSTAKPQLKGYGRVMEPYRGLRPPDWDDGAKAISITPAAAIRRHRVLGGLISRYQRAA